MKRVAIILSLGTAGCFSPRIPSGTFLCAQDEDQSCPSGQECREHEGEFVCLDSDGIESESEGEPIGRESEAEAEAEGEPIGECPDDKPPVDLRVLGGPVSGCLDEELEPNDDYANGGDLGEVGVGPRFGEFEICYEGDVDVWLWRVLEGETLVATVLDFRHIDGDLDLALLSPDGTVIDESKSCTDRERVIMPEPARVAGTYGIAVAGFNRATIDHYIVEIQVNPAAP